jgi:hypothetical protein
LTPRQGQTRTRAAEQVLHRLLTGPNLTAVTTTRRSFIPNGAAHDVADPGEFPIPGLGPSLLVAALAKATSG